MRHTNLDVLNAWYLLEKNELAKSKLENVENFGDLGIFARGLFELQKSLIRYCKNEVLPSPEYDLNSELLVSIWSLIAKVLTVPIDKDFDSIVKKMDNIMLMIENSKLSNYHVNITKSIISTGYMVVRELKCKK